MVDVVGKRYRGYDYDARRVIWLKTMLCPREHANLHSSCYLDERCGQQRLDYVRLPLLTSNNWSLSFHKMVSVLSACFPVPQRKFRHMKGEKRRKDKVKGILREVQNRRLSSGTNRKVDSSAGREELKKKNPQFV